MSSWGKSWGTSWKSSWGWFERVKQYLRVHKIPAYLIPFPLYRKKK